MNNKNTTLPHGVNRPLKSQRLTLDHQVTTWTQQKRQRFQNKIKRPK